MVGADGRHVVVTREGGRTRTVTFPAHTENERSSVGAGSSESSASKMAQTSLRWPDKADSDGTSPSTPSVVICRWTWQGTWSHLKIEQIGPMRTLLVILAFLRF